MQSSISKLQAERAEVDGILSSGVFGRTNNHVRLLTFVCEKYFEGAIDEIKEYSIAVHALGRPESFDPQVDTIVRVTAHALRRRLEDYYRSAGAEHPVHICLPPGHYVPKFIHTGALEATTSESKVEESQDGHPLQRGVSGGNGQVEGRQVIPGLAGQESKADGVPERHDGDEAQIKSSSRTRMALAAAIFVIIVFVPTIFVWKKWNPGSEHNGSVQPSVAAAPGVTSGKVLRFLL